MRRQTGAALVAVLVVLAGCGSGVSSRTPESTRTPTSASTQTSDPTPSSTATPTPIEVQGFPAISGTNVNETLLVKTHDRALANVSYTIAIDQQTGDTNITVDVKRTGNESLLTTAINGSAETDYINGSREYIRSETENGSVTYRNRSVSNASRYTGEVIIDDYIDSAQHTPVAITTYKGVEVVKLTATRADIKPNALVKNTTVDAFESRILVDRQGRIRLFTYRITGTTNGEPFSYRLQYKLFGLGSTTVDRPAWSERA